MFSVATRALSLLTFSQLDQQTLRLRISADAGVATAHPMLTKVAAANALSFINNSLRWTRPTSKLVAECRIKSNVYAMFNSAVKTMA
jgi:hypothetical protein